MDHRSREAARLEREVPVDDLRGFARSRVGAGRPDRRGARRYASAITPAADDQTLIAGAQQGDGKALDALLRRHYDRLYAVCRRIAGNDADALDATQEALLAIVRGLPRYDGRAAFTTWSYRVATNACLDELRRRSRRPDLGLPEVEVPRDDGDPPIDDQVTDRLDIDAALQQLSEEFRAPVVLRDVAGLDYAEIAEVLDLRPGTVRSRIARGRGHLARLLEGNSDPTMERTSDGP